MNLARRLKAAYMALTEEEPTTTGLNGYKAAILYGFDISPELAMSCSTVFACIRVISDTISTMPLRLYDVTGDSITEATKNPLYWVLYLKPNLRQTAAEFRKYLMWCFLLRGFYLCHIIRSGNGKVLRLKPVQPDHLSAVRVLPNGEYLFEVTDDWGTLKKYAQADMFFDFFYVETNAGWATWKSPIGYGAGIVNQALDAERYARGGLRNSRTPQGVFKTKEAYSDAAYKRLKTSLDEKLSGENVNSTLILEEGLDFQEVKMTAADLQLLDTRRFSKEEICGFFGVPPHMAGHIGQAKGWSTTEGLFREFINLVMRPHMTRMEQAARTQLIPERDWGNNFPLFDYSSFLEGDTAARGSFYSTLYNVGAISPNEIRRREKMNPREGGDAYFTPLNMKSNEKPTEPEPNPDEEEEAMQK